MKKVNLKIGLFIRMRKFSTAKKRESAANQKELSRAIELVKKSDLDLLVFPEAAWYCDGELSDAECKEIAQSISRETGKAVIIGIKSGNEIFNIYANESASKGDSKLERYSKHTMTSFSSFDKSGYQKKLNDNFPIIKLKGVTIGMTICYDCNHAPFSRVYGKCGVDVIINNSGRDVDYGKWYKYNKTRAIENNCYTLMVDGYVFGEGDDQGAYALGYNPNGKELPCVGLKSKQTITKQKSTYDLGEVYVFDLSKDDGGESADITLDQRETVNKFENIFVPVGNSSDLLKKAKKLRENLYVLPHRYTQEKKSYSCNVVFCVVEGSDIVLPEKVLPLLYADELESVKDKRYIIVNRHKKIDKSFYDNKLSVLLKVRAMENYCAVLLESDNINKCYQPTMTRGSQVVKAEKGSFGIDLNRTKGPEVIWRDKDGMKADWRENFEWLVGQLEKL
ncbi:MAG: carbon-nitrogen hydrolase family protein [Paludibacteraceae bacterium]|nr:carbon-nitrogen hydrolase family protein [Paludibacteraceae bacterium]